MTTKSGVNGNGLHRLPVLGRPLGAGAGFTAVHRGNGPGVPPELRDSEVLEQVSVNERFPQLANPGKFIATEDSVELGGGLDEEIDSIGRWDWPFTLGIGRDGSAYSRSEVLRVIRLISNGICSTVPAKMRRGRSRTRNVGGGGIPKEEARREEVQVQSTTCALSRKHSLLYTIEMSVR